MLAGPSRAIPGEEAVLRVDVAIEWTAHRAHHDNLRSVHLALVRIVDVRPDDRLLLHAFQPPAPLLVRTHAPHALAGISPTAMNDQRWLGAGELYAQTERQ